MLLYLVVKVIIVGKLTFWMMLVSVLELDIFDILGRQHMVVDYMSQMDFSEVTIAIINDFFNWIMFPPSLLSYLK